MDQARAAEPSAKISRPCQQETPLPPQNYYEHSFYGEGEDGMARKDHSRHYFSWPALALIAVVMFAVFFIVLHQVRERTHQLEFEAESLRMTITSREAEISELEKELQRVDSEGHIENFAREEYDYIRKGEIIFRFNDPSKLEGYTVEEYQFIMDEMRD